MPDQGCPPKRTRRHFLQDSFSGDRLYFIDNVVLTLHAIEFFLAHLGLFRAVATERPWFYADSVHAGYVYHRNSDFARLGEKLLNVRQRIPSRNPTAPRPRPDRIDHGLGFVAENPAVEIYQ